MDRMIEKGICIRVSHSIAHLVSGLVLYECVVDE